MMPGVRQKLSLRFPRRIALDLGILVMMHLHVLLVGIADGHTVREDRQCIVTGNGENGDIVRCHCGCPSGFRVPSNLSTLQRGSRVVCERVIIKRTTDHIVATR